MGSAKDKGRAGEREVRDVLREAGFMFVQLSSDSSVFDVSATAYGTQLLVEVKRQKHATAGSLGTEQWDELYTECALAGALPVYAFRKDRGEWIWYLLTNPKGCVFDRVATTPDKLFTMCSMINNRARVNLARSKEQDLARKK